MKLIQKGNKQLHLDDDRADALIATAGYVEIDEKTGKPIHADGGEKDLKKENAALKKENAALKKKNKELEARVVELMAQIEEQGVNPEQ